MSVSTHAHRIAAVVVLLSIALVARPTLASLVISTPGVPVTQAFNGTQTTLPMPSGWRLFTTFGSPAYSTGTTPTPSVLQGAAIATASTGIYGFRDGTSNDRSLGFIVGIGNPRNIMVEIQNNTGSMLESLALAWNMEKYREGQATLPITFFHSSDGMNWVENGAGNLTYTGDATFNAIASPISTTKSVTLSGLSLAHGDTYYLRWHFVRGEDGSQTAGVGLDDFAVTGVVAVPEASAFFATGTAGVVGWLLVRRRKIGTPRP
jgi:hypothetical protein